MSAKIFIKAHENSIWSYLVGKRIAIDPIGWTNCDITYLLSIFTFSENCIK